MNNNGALRNHKQRVVVILSVASAHLKFTLEASSTISGDFYFPAIE